MALIVEDTTTVDTGVISAVGISDRLLVLDGVTLVSTNNTAVTLVGVGNSAVIHGDLFGALFGIDLNRGSSPGVSQTTIHIGQEGSVVSTGSIGIRVNDAYGTAILNAGHISGKFFGISMEGALGGAGGYEIGNSGQIFGETAAVYFAFGSQNTLQNSGTILDVKNGVTTLIYGDLGEIRGAVISTGDDTHISNSGEILGSGLISYGVAIEGDGARVVNSGTIQTVASVQERAAIRLATDAGESGTILNSLGGTIAANGSAVYTGDGNELLRNAGGISGNVLLNGGNDRVVNSGLIDGDVDLGGGSDRLTSLSGTITGQILAGGGNDVITVNQAEIEVDGGGGTDHVRSYGSVLSLARVEKITLLGGADSDATGDTLDNAIRGNSGDNILMGLSGDDTLSGGNGADQLEGGRGADVLTGGRGADVFVFAEKAHSNQANGWDRIRDFTSGEDLIDISGLSSNSWSFVGTGGFTGGGDAEIRYGANAAGHVVVRIDTNGDGSEDVRMTLLNTAGVTLDDFLI